MINLIETHKGLDIQLAGKASEKKTKLGVVSDYALVPDDFTGIVPKGVVK